MWFSKCQLDDARGVLSSAIFMFGDERTGENLTESIFDAKHRTKNDLFGTNRYLELVRICLFLNNLINYLSSLYQLTIKNYNFIYLPEIVFPIFK